MHFRKATWRRLQPQCIGQVRTAAGKRRRARALGTSCQIVLRAILALGLGLATGHVPAKAQPDQAFHRFIEALWPDASALGVSRATFDQAFRGVELDLSLPDLVLPGRGQEAKGQEAKGEEAKGLAVKGQAEFTKTPAEYLNIPYLTKLSEQGRALMVEHAPALAKIERELGVDRQVVLAIWGRETAFGAHRSPHYAIKVLAAQAYTGRRKEMFRTELLYALKMLQDGVRTRDTLLSSWAGAMGLTQFMPSEYYTLAYDLDGDGRKDIWTSVPDALGSAANQLRAKGWVPGQAWGFEVRLPKAMSCLLEGPENIRPLREWAALGVMRTGASPFPTAALDAPAFILTPAGAYGPAFLALENFLVIKRYNMSDLYAIFVGSLADRIAGGGDFEAPWLPVRQLSERGIEEIQQRLQAVGHGVSKIDGKAGMNTRSLIGAYQQANRLKIDCWPAEALLTHLRAHAVPEGAAKKTGHTAP
jgi:lytic murein transglycosylase